MKWSYPDGNGAYSDVALNKIAVIIATRPTIILYSLPIDIESQKEAYDFKSFTSTSV